MTIGAGDVLLTRNQHEAEIRNVREAHKGAVVQAFASGVIWGFCGGVIVCILLAVAFISAAAGYY